MIEFIKHILGFCGEHWHPNIWTVTSVSPFIASFIYYVKCKCGVYNCQKKCENNLEKSK